MERKSELTPNDKIKEVLAVHEQRMNRPEFQLANKQREKLKNSPVLGHFASKMLQTEFVKMQLGDAKTEIFEKPAKLLMPQQMTEEEEDAALGQIDEKNDGKPQMPQPKALNKALFTKMADSSSDSSNGDMARAESFMSALKQIQEKKEQTAKKVKALQDAASDTEFSDD